MSDADAASPLLEQIRQLMPGIPERDIARFAGALVADAGYAPCVDATVRADVAPGTLQAHRFTSRELYPGIERGVLVYLPARTDAPLGLMVFQDGGRYLAPEINAAVVMDNLIAEGAMPPSVGLFVDPGETGPGLPIYGGEGNRSIEYDSLGDRYARFLIEELVPAFTRDLPLGDDPALRAICGLSSGGICAFNAAWERPDYFGKVISHCGSFVDIRGGHTLASAVRRAERRALRVFLQTGEHDLDIVFGGWTLANRDLAAALAYRGYDHKLVVGHGGHSLAHGGSIFGETLRWLWRDRGP